MLSSQARSSLTSQGYLAISPWNDSNCTYVTSQLNLGNNPISKLEVVSALNSFNLACWQYHFNMSCCYQKYNPMVYLSTIQTTAIGYLFDNNSGLKWGGGNEQKSGSLIRNNTLLLVNLKE